MSDQKEPKATIYTDRREWLLASVRDKRDAFEAVVAVTDPNNEEQAIEQSYYGLATTEHQFRLAASRAAFVVLRKMTARDIQQAMAEELASMGAK